MKRILLSQFCHFHVGKAGNPDISFIGVQYTKFCYAKHLECDCIKGIHKASNRRCWRTCIGWWRRSNWAIISAYPQARKYRNMKCSTLGNTGILRSRNVALQPRQIVAINSTPSKGIVTPSLNSVFGRILTWVTVLRDFRLWCRDYDLLLQPNLRLLSPDLVVEVVDGDGRSSKVEYVPRHCHFMHNRGGTKAAISLCTPGGLVRISSLSFRHISSIGAETAAALNSDWI